MPLRLTATSSRPSTSDQPKDQPFTPPNARRGARTKRPSTADPSYTTSFGSSSSTLDLSSVRAAPAKASYSPGLSSDVRAILDSTPPTTPLEMPSSSARPSTANSALSGKKKSFGARFASWLPSESNSLAATRGGSTALNVKKLGGSKSGSSAGGDGKSLRSINSSLSLPDRTPSRATQQDTQGHLFAMSNPAIIAAVERERAEKQTLLASMKAKGVKLAQVIRRKLNSKTPESELPKTFAEYSAKYARNEIDLNDPPLPPQRVSERRNSDGSPAEPTPYEQMFWPAPHPPNEAERQNVVQRLDLFGTRAAAAAAQAQASASSQTLQISVQPQVNRTRSDLSFSPPPSPSDIHSDWSASQTGQQSPRDSLLRRDSITSTAASTAAPDEQAMSMENHPVFRNIVAKCRELFNVRVGLMTVLDDEQQLFLATGGMPDGVDVLPRSVSFCSHAILNDANEALVVKNSSQDWRFANNVPSAHLGARFYCGVPLLAPTFGDPNAPSVAIGTLCVLDDKPREGVTELELSTLRRLAAEASQEVENWVNERMASKLTKLEDMFQQKATLSPAPSPGLLMPPSAIAEVKAAAQIQTPPQTPPSNGRRNPLDRRPRTAPAFGAAPAPMSALPATPPARTTSIRNSVQPQPQQQLQAAKPIVVLAPPQQLQHARQTSDSSLASFLSSSPPPAPPAALAPSAPPPAPPARSALRPLPLGLALTTEDPVPSIPRETQKVFDTATKTLLRALDLSLVYLVALDLAPSNGSDKPLLRVLSACNLPHPAPAFDPILHLKALRAPEGGLLYKNARFDPNEGAGFAAGMLIPIMEVRRTGYVLSGYTKDLEREFGQKDLTMFVRFAEQLEQFVVGLGRA